MGRGVVVFRSARHVRPDLPPPGGGLFWPGEVRSLDSLPPDIRDGFLKTPLVVVKFFDEDGYEFVLNEKDIYRYNCDKKVDFIKRGLARARTKAKEGVTEG